MPDNTNAAADQAGTESNATAQSAAPDEQRGASTVLGDNDESATTQAASWPDDWRDRAAKGDEKKLAKLGRYASPEAAMDALFAAQQKLSSGELKSSKPKGDSPEELKAWRAENGIPEDPKGYDLTLPDGLVIGEADKPLVDTFLSDLHAVNASPDVVKSALASYYKMQDQQIAARYEADAQMRAATEDELRSEWGADYRSNVNSINGLLDSAPEGVKDKILTARFADGSPLANDSAALRWLASLSREINPIATVVPGAGANAHNAINDEITALESRMKTDRKAYYKDEKAQSRYRELVTARDRMKK